jgi:DNA-binding transcriptional regulator GbsR (MarR family)
VDDLKEIAAAVNEKAAQKRIKVKMHLLERAMADMEKIQSLSETVRNSVMDMLLLEYLTETGVFGK